MSLRALWFALPLGLCVACGGKSEGDEGSGGASGTSGGTAGSTGGNGALGGNDGGANASGGTSSGGTGVSGTAGSDGGTPATGGSGAKGGRTGVGGSAGSNGGVGGVSGTAGDAGTSGASGGCCLAIPICPAGMVQVSNTDPCPQGFVCEDVTQCCSTITCAQAVGLCDGIPHCDPGDDEAMRGACPTNRYCYERYLCGSSVYCSDDTCSATPGKEPNRHYDPTGMCQPQGDYCPEYTSPFHNDCGCGCEQDVTCPPTIDCSPGPEPNPNCTEEALAQCPYSTRAL